MNIQTNSLRILTKINTMIDFNKYIESLKKDVTERPPKNEAERGFRIAVMLIYSRFNPTNHNAIILTKKQVEEGRSNAYKYLKL